LKVPCSEHLETADCTPVYVSQHNAIVHDDASPAPDRLQRIVVVDIVAQIEYSHHCRDADLDAMHVSGVGAGRSRAVDRGRDASRHRRRIDARILFL